MSTLILQLDDGLARRLEVAAASQFKKPQEWIAAQLERLLQETPDFPGNTEATNPPKRQLGMHAGPGYRMSPDFNEPDDEFANLNS